ncbi:MULTISPECIES: TRADD-N-associated membrane domain-containing protein [unclassified Streptomyces]|uniref:TRADD-N-associated membrane domain-containing protein n=1 Tax=unclassified Streptomyces TaxID=2593676 RepID=UPI002E8076B0|nr:hypothetical protein [Streptomyces sp. NBC_00589]WTI37809.1 hypothetical protein OIC96_23775 [Streptomyces sp. NBC_00775]WUB28512.1 hypothetical protein OHA51_25960 [Streptomyces sp. NBC_00589]
MAIGRDVQVVVTGDNATIHTNSPQAGPGNAAESLASQRQRLFFDSFRQALHQSETTFRLSVYFMAGGAAVILAAAVLALVHAGNPDLSYMPLVTGLTGVLITAGGGALAVHANRARDHLKERAVMLDAQIEEDHMLERASDFIDRVENTDLKDRLNSASALRALGIEPPPEMLADRVLPPNDNPRELDPGADTP